MKSQDANFNIGPRLLLTFAFLIALILGGNGLLLWQFHIARQETDRLTSVNQQAIMVLRLQQNLFSFHQRLEELAQSRDAHRLVTEAGLLRGALLERTQESRSALTHLSETPVDPAFLPTLEAIEIVLSSQIEAVTELAKSGEWDSVDLRLAKELEPVEAQTSGLVNSIDQEVREEQSRALANMRNVQRRIFFLVPITAISTFFTAAFFAWAIARRIDELRFDERLAERTRLARELHDTLLQGFQGVMFRLQAVRDLLPARTTEAIQALDTALDRGDQAIAEGRDAVQGLRSCAVTKVTNNDLVQRITVIAKELAAGHGNADSVAFNLLVEGQRCDLDPTLQDEIYRIAREALGNAFQHSKAHKIEAEITYGESTFRLRIRDDGSGIDPNVRDLGGRTGHWGLTGMRERAQMLGG